MDVEVNRLGVVTYLSPNDALTEGRLKTLDKSVRSLDSGDSANIVIDLRNVPFIDSQGLEYILDLSVELKEAGGSLRLANANSTCRDILSLTQLDRTILVCEDVETAGRSFL
jgi:anti-anti-sigma factor